MELRTSAVASSGSNKHSLIFPSPPLSRSLLAKLPPLSDSFIVACLFLSRSLRLANLHEHTACQIVSA